MVDGVGAILMISLLIAVLFILLFVFRMLADCFVWLSRLYKYLKKKLQYNALLRFVL